MFLDLVHLPQMALFRDRELQVSALGPSSRLPVDIRGGFTVPAVV